MSMVPRCSLCDSKLDPYGRDGTTCPDGCNLNGGKTVNNIAAFALDAAIANASRCRALKSEAQDTENEKARMEYENAEDYFDRAAEALRIAISVD